MLSALTRYARSFFTSAPVSQEQALAAKETVESLVRSPVAVFSKSYCPYCTEAKTILSQLGQTPRMKVIELDREALGGPIQQYLAEKAGASRVTVPQIYIKGQNIGGCSDLKKLQREGKLDQLLA
ncbi:dithiol glutaredoxin [Rhodotorula taiwanensis]|uniref:Dithiol glutaredoxin n=1 Tax=Rhodotorula taiwanensis TaxID=741276 RepID=A0A2S5B5B5_9BASI|nr:dithiol glutaredoxin [Rhodotorula taiwanensis]